MHTNTDLQQRPLAPRQMQRQHMIKPMLDRLAENRMSGTTKASERSTGKAGNGALGKCVRTAGSDAGKSFTTNHMTVLPQPPLVESAYSPAPRRTTSARHTVAKPWDDCAFFAENATTDACFARISCVHPSGDSLTRSSVTRPWRNTYPQRWYTQKTNLGKVKT